MRIRGVGSGAGRRGAERWWIIGALLVLAEAIVLPLAFGAGVRDVLVYGLCTATFFVVWSNHRLAGRVRDLRRAQAHAPEADAAQESAVGR